MLIASNFADKNAMPVAFHRIASVLSGALVCGALQAQTYAPPAFADSGRAARVRAALPEIDKMYGALAASAHLPGLVYGVVLDGKLIHSRALGLANLERKLPVTSSTQFRIASMTKSFVAMAVMKLRDEGKLRLDDPVGDYLPELRSLRLPTLDSPALTLRHLMTMNTGLPEDNPWGDRQMELDNAALTRFVSGGLSFSNVPGQGFEYSNLGFVLLGKVVTKVAGMRYQDYIAREILLPLGMKDTLWEYSKASPERFALGYRWEHEQWKVEPILHDGDAAAMGGLITTMDDFARYVAFHLGAWPARDEADSGPLRRATVREMQQPRVFAILDGKATLADGKTPNPKVSFYGYGLSWLRDSGGVVIVGHSGGLPGYGSQYRFAPDHGVALIAFSNLRYAPVYGPTSKALAELIERAALAPRAVAPSPTLLARQRQVADLVQGWDAALGAAITADNFFLDRSRADWIDEAKRLLAPIGKVRSVDAIEAENQLRGSFTLTGERGQLRIAFTLSPEREPKLQELTITAVAKP
ncbi:MAG: serine hydrolase domain-containing protein [Pseudomonadota bacterium]